MQRGHAEALLPLIEAVLAEARCGYGDLDILAVCTGPGSFTGVRIGVAAVRGLALSLGVPAVGVSRFDLARALAPDVCAVRIPVRGGITLVQAYDAAGLPDGAPRTESGAAVDVLPDPVLIGRIAAARAASGEPIGRPAPLYVVGPDAALPSAPPVRILDA